MMLDRMVDGPPFIAFELTRLLSVNISPSAIVWSEVCLTQALDVLPLVARSKTMRALIRSCRGAAKKVTDR